MMKGMRRLGTVAALFLVIAMPLAADPPSWSSGTYVYDPSGNIVKIGSDRYTYDLLSRIKTGTAGAGHSQSYEYDPFGNITNIVTDSGAPLIPGVNAATNRISTSTGSNAYGTYDAAGNMVTYLGLYTYAYDAANMVKEITGPNSQHEVYLYTVDDERIAAGTVSGAGGGAAITGYRYTIRDLDNKVLREFDDSISGSTHTWSWKEDFVYANEQLLATESVPRTLHFFSDHLGTPRLITDGAYNQIARHDYYPFGMEATSPAQDGEVMKFTGHERDATLDYMHARYYMPTLGRFLSADAVLGAPTRPATWNRYAYVGNNPLASTDPTGQCDESVAADGRDTQATLGGTPCSDMSITVEADDPLWTSAIDAVGDAAFQDMLREAQYNRLMRAVPYDDFASLALGLPPSTRGIGDATSDLMWVALPIARAAIAPVAIANPVPYSLARVIPGELTPATLGRLGTNDVFVTAADDIAGMDASQLGARLGIPNSDTYTVIEFPTPPSGIASPIMRSNPGFIGRGLTSGGAREFVIPNGPIPWGGIIRVVRTEGIPR